MSCYDIQLTKRGAKQFAALEKRSRERVAHLIDELAFDPRPDGAKLLEAREGIWRIRVAAYRVIYTIEDAQLTVLVIKIGHRRDVYRNPMDELSSRD